MISLATEINSVIKQVENIGVPLCIADALLTRICGLWKSLESACRNQEVSSRKLNWVF